MSQIDFTLNAELREGKGKGASRRLRRTGMVPAIIYGAGKEPTAIALNQLALMHNLENEAIYSHILTVDISGKKEKAILRDLQRHPYKAAILHMDLQRVSDDEAIRVNVPLHFIGEEDAPGVKTEGGEVSHLMTEVEVSCLPKDLPEFISIDISGMHMNEILHLSDIKLPAGVEIVELSYGEEHDQGVVNLHQKRMIEEPLEGEEEAAATPAKPEEKKADPSNKD